MYYSKNGHVFKLKATTLRAIAEVRDGAHAPFNPGSEFTPGAH
jgi:hypothetical protein